MNSQQGPHKLPQPSNTTAITSTPAPIAVGPGGTVISTAPAIKGGDVAKLILLTVVLIPGADELVSVDLERDGVSIAAGVFTEPVSTGVSITRTFHWVDTAPGKGEPVYSIRAVGTVGSCVAGRRRITVANI